MEYPYLGVYPGFLASSSYAFNDTTEKDFLNFPEETQLELLRRGGDSNHELRRKIAELRKKE